MAAGENDDVLRVYQAEKRRGRRPVDEERKRRRARMFALAAEAIRNKDERGFLNALRAGGVKDGTDEFARAWKLFREKTGIS